MANSAPVISKSAHPKKKNFIKRQRLWIHHHKAFYDAWNQILLTPLSSLITCLVMSMTILLTTTLLVTLKSFQEISHYVNASSQITLYLNKDSSKDNALSWINGLKETSLIREVTYISREQALEDLSKQADYQNILVGLSENPLPPVMLIKLNLNDKSNLQPLIEKLKSSPFVSAVNVDFDWLDRLSTLLKLAGRISYTLSILFGMGILFIIGHAIQEATQRNQQEMIILQLMGASTSYIRRPFLYLGTLLGIGAGLMTMLLLLIFFLPLKQPLKEIIQSYHLPPNKWMLDFAVFFKTLLLSTLLGWLGAWLSFYRHTKLATNLHRSP